MDVTHYVCNMAALEDLDTYTLRVGDLCIVTFDGTDRDAKYAWDGTAWNKLGGTVTTLENDETYTHTNVITAVQHYTNRGVHCRYSIPVLITE